MWNQVAVQVDSQLGLSKNMMYDSPEEWTEFMGLELKNLTSWCKISQELCEISYTEVYVLWQWYKCVINQNIPKLPTYLHL